MSFFVYHRYGNSERDPPKSSFAALLDELEVRVQDEEHTSVSLLHESEWSLAVVRGGYVSFENVEAAGPARHMRGVSREKVLELMELLAAGDLHTLEKEPWQEGY